MTESDAKETLRSPEGERLFLLLVDFADKLARRYGWRTGMTLPESQSPDAIATDVIVKVLTGQRVWDPTKESSLLNALKGMVRSELSHLYDSQDVKRLESTEKTLPDGTERTADSFPSSNRSPEEQVLLAEQARLDMHALEILLQEVDGKPDLEAVLLALYETDSADEIAQKTGLPKKRVYSLRRELDRAAGRITPARVIRAAREKGRR